MRENVGYQIIKSISLPNCEFVLGENQKSQIAKYVTWLCYNNKDYYFGHYINSEIEATKDLYERAKEEINIMLYTIEQKLNRKD